MNNKIWCRAANNGNSVKKVFKSSDFSIGSVKSMDNEHCSFRQFISVYIDMCCTSSLKKVAQHKAQPEWKGYSISSQIFKYHILSDIMYAVANAQACK